MENVYRIIATIGPASENRIVQLIQAGATGFRLNCSHLAPTQLARWLENLQAVFQTRQEELPVWLDLQGSKMRIGELEQIIPLETGQQISFNSNSTENNNSILLPYPGVFHRIEPGARILLDDGRIELIAVAKKENSFIAEVTLAGELHSFKGFILPEIDPVLSQVSERDLAFMRESKDYSFTGYAISYVRNADEIDLFRQETAGHQLTAKIERVAAFEHLPAIAKNSDSTWLCRGDLGVDGNLFDLFQYEKSFIKRMSFQNKPFLIAGQVLENMVHQRYPSRSEVAHLGYLLENGFSGVVLSDETATGKYPAAAVRFCHDYFEYLNQSKLHN